MYPIGDGAYGTVEELKVDDCIFQQGYHCAGPNNTRHPCRMGKACD